MDIRALLSKNLRELRKERGLTQASLASLAGFQETSYNRWETGKVWPEPDTLAVLAKVLNVPESRLFYDESLFTPKMAIKVLNSFIEQIQ